MAHGNLKLERKHGQHHFLILLSYLSLVLATLRLTLPSREAALNRRQMGGERNALRADGACSHRGKEMKRSKTQSPMLIEERRQHILSLIQKHGRVLVDELSNDLNLSKITIRKDLDYLQSKDLRVRTDGGALPAQAGALSDPTIQEKEELHHEEKVKIAKAAAAMVSEGQCIILDSGTTTTKIARSILSFRYLTVIALALNIAADLARSDFEIILIDGTLRKKIVVGRGPVGRRCAERDARGHPLYRRRWL